MTPKLKSAIEVAEELRESYRFMSDGEEDITNSQYQALTTLIDTCKRIDEGEQFAKKTSKKSKEMLTICENENFVFNNLDDRWQKLAFTFYSEIVQLSSEAQSIYNMLTGEEM